MPANTNPLDIIDYARATPEALVDALIFINHQISTYETKRKEISTYLNGHLELGTINSSFTYDGHSISYSPGRKTYTYPDNVTELEAQLQEAKAVAVAAGMAQEKYGKPFWTVRQLKQ